jgi:hypothetical protein
MGEQHAFSSMLASFMIAVISTPVWHFLLLFNPHGSASPIKALLIALAIALLMSWPAWLILGPVFFIYVYRTSRRHLPWTNLAAAVVTIGCFLGEIAWVNYLWPR